MNKRKMARYDIIGILLFSCRYIIFKLEFSLFSKERIFYTL